MIRPGSVGAVFRFEWRRSLTVPRMAWWLALAGFPVLLTALVKSELQEVPELPPPPVVKVDLNTLAADGSLSSITVNSQEVTENPLAHLNTLARSFDARPMRSGGSRSRPIGRSGPSCHRFFSSGMT